MITEYDQRQISRMRQQVSSFEHGTIQLAGLIGDLEFLLSSLESDSIDWKKGLDDQIFILEEVYADALDKGIEELEPESQALVAEAIEAIKRYISSDDRIGDE